MKGESNGQVIQSQVSSLKGGTQRVRLRSKCVPWGQAPSEVREERKHTVRVVHSYPTGSVTFPAAIRE